MGSHTFEHVLSLAIENTGARLQVLLLEEIGECEGLGLGWAGLYGLRLALLGGLLRSLRLSGLSGLSSALSSLSHHLLLLQLLCLF